MDLYRYFHPHHNPRLRNVPLRMQELAELEQAGIELARALRRAEIRSRNAPMAEVNVEHIVEVGRALEFAVESLRVLTRAHPGDSQETMECLLRERKDAPGWENWATLLRERLKLVEFYEGSTTQNHPPLRKIAQGNS